MDYSEMASALIKNLFHLKKNGPQKHIQNSMHGESVVLRFLSEADTDGVIPSQISTEMNISSARITATLNSLENKGFITRSIDVCDRRRIVVLLTQEGRAYAQQDMQQLLDITAKMLSFLGENDAAEYVRITGKLADMSDFCGAGCMEENRV